MYFKSSMEMAAYFWANPTLTYLVVDNCPALTSLPALPSFQSILVSIKYDAHLAEKAAAGIAATLSFRQSEFPNEAAYLARRQHALDGERCAIQAQLTCARLLADLSVLQGQERPEGEVDFLTQKAQRKEAEADALQTRSTA